MKKKRNNIVFKKSVVVGVSVTPEVGLEVAQIDYESRTILKYGRKPVDYNVVRREIADVDTFQGDLNDLLSELDIPKNAEIVLSLPTVFFNVVNYPAHMSSFEIEAAIEDDIYDNQYLREIEKSTSYAIVEEDMQNKRVAFTAIQSQALIEIIMGLSANGYNNITTIDASMNSVLNALIYLSENKLAADSTKNWVLLIVENSCCRIALMSGRHYIDMAEIKISIGEVLSDAENYSTVITAVDPILRQFPASFLYIVSKTNVICAKALTDKVTYNSQITYFEANCYRDDDVFKLTAPLEIDNVDIKGFTLDVLGAAIYPDCAAVSDMRFNYYNKTLGDIYTSRQPLTMFGGKVILNAISLVIAFAILCFAFLVLFGSAFAVYCQKTESMNKNIKDMKNKIAILEAYIKTHESLANSDFDEGQQIMDGIEHNKRIYSYYTVVGTEIPQKLWLTHLNFGDKTTIEGQADNIESVYAFYRNVKDIIPDAGSNSELMLQKLSLATTDNQSFTEFDPESLLTMLDADFYEFCISNDKSLENQNNKNSAEDLQEI